MKVLHVLGSNSFSGAENVACQIINMTSDFAESIYVCKNGCVKSALEARNIKNIMLNQLSISALRNIFKFENPDVVHAHDMKASFLCSIAMGNKAIFISHIHNNNYNSRRITVKSILYAFAAYRADHIIWVSKAAYEGYFFSKFFKHKSNVLYNVIDTSKIKKKIEEDMTNYYYDIIFVGRLTYPKNPQKFVEIIAKLCKYFPYVRAAMIGSGKDHDEITPLINQNRLEKNIELLGFVDNPYKIMSCSKIQMITSEWEGTPMCALEAMFLGLPIISTPVDGMKDLIKHNINGFFAKDSDTFVEYAKCLLENEELSNKMAQNTKRIFKTINSFQDYADTIKNLYMGGKSGSIVQ